MKKYPVSVLSSLLFALTLSTALVFSGCAGKTEATTEEDTLTEVPANAADAVEDGTTSTFGDELTDEEVEEVLLDDDKEKK